jgi:hypothetical protein
MRQRNLFGMLIVLLVTQAAVIGQDATPSAPWPPDSNEIFEDGVQWKEVIPTETPQLRVQIDAEQQRIQLLDSTGTIISEFGFPPEIERITQAIRVLDAQLQIEALTDASDPLSKKFFLLDTKTGDYSPAPTVCDGQRVRTNIGAPRWTFVALDEHYNSGFLCDTETDTQSDLLPDSFGRWIYLGISESEDWFLFEALDEEEFNQGNYANYIVSYHLPTGQLNKLGLLLHSSDDNLGIYGWVSNTQGVICVSSIHQYLPRFCHSFDVTQTDSLERVFSGWLESMLQLDDPPRFGAFYSDIYYAMISGGGSSQHTSCSLTIYDQKGVQNKLLGYECIPLRIDNYKSAPYIQQNNTLYFLTTNERLLTERPNATSSVLKTFDFQDMRGNYFIYKGEIESLLSISSDQRYAVVLLDNNGVLDFPFRPFEPFYSSDTLAYRGWTVGIIDMQRKELVYQSEPLGVYASSQVSWLDDRTVVIASSATSDTLYIQVPGASTPEPDFYPLSSTLLRIELDTLNASPEIHLTSEFPHQQRGAIDINTSPNGCYLLLEDHRIVNLYTFEEVAVIRDDLLNAYDLTLLWQEDDRIYISISTRGDSDEYIGYEMTLPNCTSHQP